MPYTMALLRSVPRLGGIARPQLAAIPGAPPSVERAAARLRVPSALRAPDAGRCDAEHPALDIVARDHAVRCLRWRELAEAVA